MGKKLKNVYETYLKECEKLIYPSMPLVASFRIYKRCSKTEKYQRMTYFYNILQKNKMFNSVEKSYIIEMQNTTIFSFNVVLWRS